MITFVGMESRTSGLIRGVQMAERIGGQFVELGSNVPSRNKVVIILRNYSSGVAKFYKQQGCIVGYDIADMPVGDAVFRNKEVKDLRDYTHKECDFFVVNNSLSKADVAIVSDKPTFIIPHHTTNFNKIRSNWNDEVKRIGYVGLPEQLSSKSEIETLCHSHGVEFVSLHPNTREECDSLFRTIDIGVVFAESDGKMKQHVVDLMKRYKPNTKLSNFQSYGIPTVCTPYESYSEFGGGGCRFVETKERMLYEIEHLIIEDPSMRRELADEAFYFGQKFHIDEIKKLYENIHKDYR